MEQFTLAQNEFNISILEREYKILYSDLEEASYFDSTLKMEVNDFLEDLRYQRRKLNRSYSVIKDTSTIEEDENLIHLEEQISRLDEIESNIISIIDG